MMINFPLTVVNNFLDNPEEIRKWALSLPYEKSEEGNWPGERTSPLHQIDQNFFDIVSGKILSLFFEIQPFQYAPNVEYVTSMHFQKINDSFKKGLVHLDRTSLLTGILYLNKDGNIDSGTSLFKPKTLQSSYFPSSQESEKRSYYLSENKDGLDNLIVDNRDHFYETERIAGIFNRLVLFEGNQHHAANDFNSFDEDRLTLVVFFRNIKSSMCPISRSKFITTH